MKAIWAVLVIVSILFTGFPLSSGHGNIDQSFTGPCISGGLNPFAFLPMGQSFTPTATNLVAVDLFISSFVTPTTYTLNIRSGSITGTIIGTSNTVVVNAGAGPLEHFDFPTPVPLIPGNLHVIEVTGSGSGGWCANTANPYAGGTGIQSGSIFADRDFGFTTFFLSAPIGGTITEIIDSTGDGSGGLLENTGHIATDSLGNVFVGGGQNNNVFKITPGGTITEIITGLIGPSSIATDSSDNVFAGGFSADNVFKVTPDGTVTLIISGAGDGTNVLDGTQGVATDSSGNVFVAGFGSNNVFKITPGGTITEIIDNTGDGTNVLNVARRIATDSSGNVFVAGDGSDNVFKITTPGTCSTGGTACTITEIIDSTGDRVANTLDRTFGVETDSSGNVFVAGFGTDNVFKITTPGTCSTSGTACTITEIIDSTGDGGGNILDIARGIATDSSGNVFVTGQVSDNAFKINTPGTCSTSGTPCIITAIIDSTGDGFGNILDGAVGIATDSSGNVFVGGVLSDNAFKIELVLSPAIGGHLIPIDTTALLLAGVQSISMWMIPVVVAGIGIGIFVIIRRK